VGDRVTAIDTRRRRVHLSRGAPLHYDRLVVAPGIRFLSAMRPGGVVAISVPAGPMRCPPGPFERASLIAGFLKLKNPRAKILIFDANNHFPKQDIFTDVWQTLYPEMIQWIPVVEGGAVIRVEAGLASDHGWCPMDARTFESTLVPGVHVIGDACIADPMPKAASSAHAQAKHCARAIAAALGGRNTGEPPLQSLCYSLLASDRALAMHARFELTGLITQLPALASAAVGPEEVQEAADWYRRIVADSFGA
jgi:sulfide dehydrogenase [flavocytochrome c] flavoprotein subunit